MVKGNALVDALAELSSGPVREWSTDSYEDAEWVREVLEERFGWRVRMKYGGDDTWIVERLGTEQGRWFP